MNTAKTPIRRRNSPGRPSTGDSAIRVEKLLDVAAETFMERGYDGTSVGEIAKRAGASKQTLYSRYPSKASLFKAVMQRKSEPPHARFKGILCADTPVRQVLQSFGMEIMERNLDPESLKLNRTSIGHVKAFPELAHTMWDLGPKQCCEMLEMYIRNQVKRGVLRAPEPAVAASLFYVLCGRYLLQAQLRIKPLPSRKEQRAFVQEAVRVFLAAYGPQLPSART